jgi:RHS repeat-associated protein
MIVCFFCLLGFLGIAVGAQAQCSTPPCIASFTIAPGTIPGDSTTTAIGTITLNLGQYTNQENDVGLCCAFAWRCLPPAVYDYNSGIECVANNCKLPKGVNTLQVAFWGANTTQSPVTGTEGAVSCSINSMSASLTLNPVPPPQPLGPDTPDPCPVCNNNGNGGGNGSGGSPGDGIDPSSAATGGGPVNLANGNTYIQQQDYSLPGARGGLSLGRTWHSMWQALLGTDSGAPGQAGMFGNGWISSYEQRLNLHTVNGGSGVKVWSSSGNSNFFSYNASLSHYTPVSPLTLQAGLTFNSSNNTYTYTSHDGTQQVFTQAGYLTTLIDRNNNQTVISYDGQNRITQVTDPVGRWIKFNYSDSNNPKQATSVYDAVGTIATYTYSNNDGNLHRLLSITYADGTALQFQYNDPNSNTLISAVVDGAGKVIEQHTYDTQRRGLTSARALVPASSTTIPVEKVSVQYSSTSNQATLTNSRNYQTTYTFAAFGTQNYMSSVSGPGCSTCRVGAATSNAITSLYNPNGTLASRTSGRSSNIADLYTYDSSDNLISKSQDVLPPNLSLGLGLGDQTWQYTYNSFGEVLTATDPLGFVTTYQYDTHGNLISITTPSPDGGTTAGSVTHFTYDTAGTGLLTQVTDPDTNSTTIGYTPSTQCTNQGVTGLVASVTDAHSKTTNFCYDLRGNRTDVYDALGRHTQFQYDGRNRVTQVTHPDLTTVKYQYDALRGRLAQATDQNNLTTQYAYDDANRLISVTDAQTPTAGVIQYAYDTEDNLTSITDALGRQTSYVYDSANHLQTVYFPVQGTTVPTESYNFDEVGNLLSHTDRNGQTIQFAYDSLNRLNSKTWQNSNPAYSATYTYDMDNRLAQVTDPTGTYGFTYDNMKRLKQSSTHWTGLGFPTRTFTVSYTYDAASNRKTMRDAENGLTTYNYDVLNRLQSIVDFNNNTFGFGYDDTSRRTSLTRPNGVSTSYAYKPNTDFLQSILHQVGGTAIDGTAYTYDNAGNRLTKVSFRPQSVGPITSSFGYDNIYQLTGATLTCDQGSPCPQDESYTYDLVGNRLSDFNGTTYTYNNPWNRLDAVAPQIPGDYSYDNNGNLISFGTNYYWDFENRLTGATTSDISGVGFQYDPFGRRIQRLPYVESVNYSNSVNYLYDGPNIIEEVDSNGHPLARYSQGPSVDQPLSMTRSGVTSFYEADGLGSITSLTNSAGSITDTYTYDSFGNLTTSNGTTINPFRYTGREYDAETGLYYYRARYYDSSTGRFISEDPIRFRGGIDFYAYVGNDPANLDDPLGLQGNPYENITENASKMGPAGPQFCDKDKNCRMFISCATTPNTHGQMHCTVTIQNGDDYTDFDGEPTGGILLSNLQVVMSEGGEPPNSFTNAAVPCDCVKREADAINAAGLLYSFPIQNSNTAAAMMAAACGVFPDWPWRVWGTFRNSPLPTR